MDDTFNVRRARELLADSKSNKLTSGYRDDGCAYAYAVGALEVALEGLLKEYDELKERAL